MFNLTQTCNFIWGNPFSFIKSFDLLKFFWVLNPKMAIYEAGHACSCLQISWSPCCCCSAYPDPHLAHQRSVDRPGKYWGVRFPMVAVFAWNGRPHVLDGREPFDIFVGLLCRLPPAGPLQLPPHKHHRRALTLEGSPWRRFQSLLPQLHLLPLPCHCLLLLLLHQQEEKVFLHTKCYCLYFWCLLQVHSLYE